MAARPIDILLRESRAFIIRDAVEADLPRILELGEQLFNESDYSNNFPYVPDKVEKLVAGMLHNPDRNIILVAENSDGVIIGGFAGLLYAQWYSNELVANDLAIFIEQSKRSFGAGKALIDAFIVKAKSLGANSVVMINSTGIRTKQVESLFERCGLTRACGVFKISLR